MGKVRIAGCGGVACLVAVGLACSSSRSKDGADGAAAGARGQDAARESGEAAVRDAAGDSDGESDVADAVELDGGDAGVPEFVARQCARSPGPALTYSSTTDLRAHLEGEWASCGVPTLFERSIPSLVVSSDDTWYFSAGWYAGAPIRIYGADLSGTLDYPAPGAVRFIAAQSGSTFIAIPNVEEDPPTMTLGADGAGHTIRYVLVPPSVYGPPPAVTPPPPDGVIACRITSDCPAGKRCFIDAVISSCPSDAIGHCFNAGEGICDTFGPFDPCACLEQFWPQNAQTPKLPCADLQNASCQRFSAGTSNECEACAPNPVDASTAP